jgi:pimeloyl-ACP methyl ester carboxylesterase
MPRISVNNVELYYEKHGAGAQPVVFVHGFLLSSRMWHDLYISRLPERYHAYAIDMRGHGQSHHVKDGCNLVQMADDVYRFVQQLQLGTVRYVGVSMGGAIGLQLALDHPEVLKALVLMNPGLGSTVSGFYRLFAPLLPLMAGNRWFLTALVKSMMTRSLPEGWLQAFLEQATLVSRHTWAEYGRNDNRIHSLDRLRQFGAPTLVMIGGKDRILPLDVQHQIAETIPNAQKVVFEDEGHGMVGEAPERVFGAMRSFLDELS